MAIQGNRHLKELVGKVVSTAMQDTIVVSIPVVKMHPLYKKRYTEYKKCYAHVDSSTQNCELGDRVKIIQAKPRSRTKKWDFVEKVS